MIKIAVYKGTPTKDGRTWYFRVYKKDPFGKNHQYSSDKYKTKTEAKEQEALFILKRDNPIHKYFILVAKDYFKWLSETRKESTVYTYKNDYKCHIEPFFQNMYIDSVNVQNVRDWAEYVSKKNISVKYKNKLYGILKGIFDFGIRNYGLTSNPVSLFGRFQVKNEDVIKDKNKLRYITYEDFNKYISVIDDITWKTFFIFLYYTGMRKGEVQALRIKDIDFAKNEIIVDKTLSVHTDKNYKITNTKNKLNRVVKMSNVLINQLNEYLEYLKNKYSDYNENWFLFGCTRFLPQTTIDRYKKYYFKKYNEEHKEKIQEITIHEFRHSHVSLLVNEYLKKCNETRSKIDTFKFFVMTGNRLGHTVEIMQKVYLVLFPTVQDEVIDLLNNL